MYYFQILFHLYGIILYENVVLILVFNCVRPYLINNLQLCKGLYELVTRQNNKNKTFMVILLDPRSFVCHICFLLLEY